MPNGITVRALVIFCQQKVLLCEQWLTTAVPATYTGIFTLLNYVPLHPWAWLDWQLGRYNGWHHPGTQWSPAHGSLAWDLPPHVSKNLAGCKQVPGLLAWDLPDVLNGQGVMKKCVCMSVHQCVTAERTLFSHVLLPGKPLLYQQFANCMLYLK